MTDAAPENDTRRTAPVKEGEIVVYRTPDNADRPYRAAAVKRVDGEYIRLQNGELVSYSTDVVKDGVHDGP